MSMMRFAAVAALLIGVSAAVAAPPFSRKGTPASVGAPPGDAVACDPGSSVCAQFSNGQTLVTWDDVGTDGPGGANTRYRVYRSAVPITSGNYGSASLVASYVLNNSAQLFGGVLNWIGSAFTQTNRQNATLPMSKIPDLVNGGVQTLPVYSGLQAYTAKATETAYYAVVSTDTSDGSPSFIGSTGPISESVAAPQPTRYSSATSGFGTLVSPAGKPVILYLHQSGSSGGCPAYCGLGDYWEWWLTTAEGWQDGRATTINVLQDNGAHFVGTPSSLEVTTRDTIWNPLGTGGLETSHQGLGLTPNASVGAANRWYPTTSNGIARMLSHVISYYGADSAAVHCTGVSMGAWGCSNVAPRQTNPRFSSAWMGIPSWRLDHQGSGYWPGLTWGATMPFKATIATAPSTLGVTASSVLTGSGETWGGDGNYADTLAILAESPGDDMPAMMYLATKNDPFASWGDQLTAKTNLQTARRGHGFVWAVGAHETASPIMGLLNCDWPTADTSVCYNKSRFKLNTPYLATSNSSIDDDPGNGGTTANGLVNGDYSGCVNCGFTWNFTVDTSTALAFTVDNTWMDKTPTANPQTTLTGTMASSGTGTVAVTNGAVFQSVSTYQYFLINGTEVVNVTGVSGNNVTYTSRGLFGSSAASHSAGQTIMQFVARTTGPNDGPFTTMTADITPRRMQGFLKPNGTTINCTVTPNGESPVAKSGTVGGSSGVFTITGIKINASGATSVSCS